MRSSTTQQLISELETEDFEWFTDTALGEDIVDLRTTIDRLEFQCSRRLDLFARRHGYEAFGFVTLISWLRRACRLLPGAASQRAEVARNLPSLPDISNALAAGEIGFHHAAVIAHSVTEVGVEAVARQEPTLLEAAHNLDPKLLSYVTRTIRYCEDADGALAADNEIYDRRYLHISQALDGIFVIDGQLDAEGGAIVRAAIGACEHPFQPHDAASRSRSTSVGAPARSRRR